MLVRVAWVRLLARDALAAVGAVAAVGEWVTVAIAHRRLLMTTAARKRALDAPPALLHALGRVRPRKAELVQSWPIGAVCSVRAAREEFAESTARRV